MSSVDIHLQDLIWSGACDFKNQNAFDFRPFNVNGSDHLSAILAPWEHDSKGRGITMNDSYGVTHSISTTKTERNMNMHELLMGDNGKTAVYVTRRPDWVDVSELSPYGVESEAGWLLNMGFREVEVETGKVLFEWWALDHIPIATSSVEIQDLEGPPPAGWDFLCVLASAIPICETKC
jgi:hypothetical protein